MRLKVRTHGYWCWACGKTVARQRSQLFIRSHCDSAGRYVRLWRRFW